MNHVNVGPVAVRSEVKFLALVAEIVASNPASDSPDTD